MIGGEKMFNFREEISYKDALLINKMCLMHGEPFQVVDENRLRSSLGNQFAPYPSNELAFASVYKSIIINHAFMNGNKRTAVIVLYLFSVMIDNILSIDDKELAELTYRIANEGGSLIDVQEIANTIFKHKKDVNNIRPLNDIEHLAKTYIKEHEWLMKELAK